MPRHPGHPEAIVPDRTDDSRDVRAVEQVVKRIVVGVGEVPPRDVVHQAVAVVIDPVARDLARIDVEVVAQVGVRRVDTAVDHRDDHVARAGRDVPGAQRVEVVPRRAPRLPRIAHHPLLREPRVVGDAIGVHDVVRLGVLDVRVGTQPVERLLHRRPFAETPLLGTAAERRPWHGAHLGADRGAFAQQRGGAELDEDVVGRVRRVGGERDRRGRRGDGGDGSRRRCCSAVRRRRSARSGRESNDSRQRRVRRETADAGERERPGHHPYT
jgi:hypothetical protein